MLVAQTWLGASHCKQRDAPALPQRIPDPAKDADLERCGDKWPLKRCWACFQLSQEQKTGTGRCYMQLQETGRLCKGLGLKGACPGRLWAPDAWLPWSKLQEVGYMPGILQNWPQSDCSESKRLCIHISNTALYN